MTELIKAYETDFSKHLATANKKLSGFNSGKVSDGILNEIKRDISQAESLIKQMWQQMSALPGNQSAQYQKKVQRHSENLRLLKKNLEDELGKKGKVELFGKGVGNDREKLLTNNEVLIKNGDTIENSLRIGIESEIIASETVNTLKKQRTQIVNINEKVNDIANNVVKANRSINTMERRRIIIKLTMMLTVFLLTIVLGLILLIKLG
jgi:Snare region anchored in the vesicle membrane C-terminus/Vesicle transport v-SNARE protein N-terminus